MWSYVGYEGDDGNTFEPVEDDEFLIFNNYHFMTMSMDYALVTITETYSYTVKEINEQGENNVSDIEYDPSVYTVTVNVDENMDMSITYTKNGTNVDNSAESVDGISFENKMSVTAAIDPAVKKVLNNAELQPGEFTFQLFDENNNLIDTIVDSYYWKCYVRSGRGIIPASVRAADRRNDRYCTFSEQIDRIIRFDVRAGI